MLPQSTRFWLIRHALVDSEARKRLYGTEDVPICESTLLAQADAYAALGRRLPQPARWLVTPLSRTHRTAQAIFAGGYPAQDWTVDPAFIEQSFGQLQGMLGTDLPQHLTLPSHDFWPISHAERPDGGESFEEVIGRIGVGLEALTRAHKGEDIVIVCHGGAIRAAIAHALGLGGETALRLSIGNISLTRLEKRGQAWRVISANETVEGVPVL
ncbi:histidine phosphatase family protein [Acidisoma silvae]|uniref:Histidine phosphatase family protein n=1 Tax=Acidisoma silvae TaxID=2802396 RepID=A0A963YPI7_9PROT|nr:histidine phosphatase family protein [Acidisoma silvae]MCB8874386.1 histidine phosphatase family protein [Acidisoma silvae]